VPALAALGLGGLLALLSGCASPRAARDAAPGAASSSRGALRVQGYRVSLTPDFEARAIAGITTLELVAPAEGAQEVSFPVEPLAIDRVTAGASPLPYTVEGGLLTVRLARPLGRGEVAAVTIGYHGRPLRGLVWGARSVHTTFFACEWMVCDPDRPGDKASFTLELVLPAGLEVVASGRPAGEAALPDGRVRHTWAQARPYSGYLLGFAVGRFHRVALPSGGAALEAVGETATPERLQALFGDTDRMRAFFEAKAGVPLPQPYTQVLVEGAEAQEASSLSFIGRENLEPILEDPREDWVIAHELAHQWWGNLVTCADWRDFWLDEGLTVFLVAAYKEHRWGRADYERELSLARRRHARAVEAGFDVPLAWAGPYPSLAVKRAITYSKGALFLHALREQLGDDAFWRGLRQYTVAHAGGTVESRDLQRALEAASGQDLSAPFATWVYGR
jgi:hypothetical protein